MPRTNRIESRIADLTNLQFHPIPVKPMRSVAAVVRTENAIVMVSVDGRVFTSQAQTCFYWRTERQLRHTVACLIKIGMLTQAAVDQHRKQEVADALVRDQRWAARAVLDGTERLSVPLNKTQRTMLEKFAAKQVTE